MKRAGKLYAVEQAETMELTESNVETVLDEVRGRTGPR